VTPRESETRGLVRIAIDYEHESRRWWESGGQDLWDAVLESPGSNDVVLDGSLAESWLSQARAIEGWDDGPEYAPHPLTLQPVDEDADV
jgi:hypothetical protein